MRMRTFILTLGIVVGLLMIPALAAAVQIPQINVDIHEGGTRAWNPMWIAIGVIGLLLVAVLFKMSNRGSAR